MREHGGTLSRQPIRTSSLVRLEGDNQATTLEPCQHLVESSRWQVNSRELLNVFNQGIAVLVSAREARQHQYTSCGVASETCQSITFFGHHRTISISDTSVNEVDRDTANFSWMNRADSN